MLVMENKQRIILVIQIMTNSLMTLPQVNLLQKNLVMMTQAMLLMEIRQMTMKAARKKIMKMTSNKQEKALLVHGKAILLT